MMCSTIFEATNIEPKSVTCVSTRKTTSCALFANMSRGYNIGRLPENLFMHSFPSIMRLENGHLSGTIDCLSGKITWMYGAPVTAHEGGRWGLRADSGYESKYG